tara:strand:- start:375 stop:689 length:315 start_codon:yes stop_codon:yes gene_type:complete
MNLACQAVIKNPISNQLLSDIPVECQFLPSKQEPGCIDRESRMRISIDHHFGYQAKRHALCETISSFKIIDAANRRSGASEMMWLPQPDEGRLSAPSSPGGIVW